MSNCKHIFTVVFSIIITIVTNTYRHSFCMLQISVINKLKVLFKNNKFVLEIYAENCFFCIISCFYRISLYEYYIYHLLHFEEPESHS